MPPPDTAHVDLAEAVDRLERASGARFVELLRRGSVRVEYYAPRGHDPQSPHAQDELYVVATGRGVFFDGETRRPVAPGTLLFVRAGRPHRFEECSDDFGVWVVFYGPEGGEIAAP